MKVSSLKPTTLEFLQNKPAERLKGILANGINSGFGTDIHTAKLGKGKWAATHLDAFIYGDAPKKEVRGRISFLNSEGKRANSLENGVLGIGKTEKLARFNLLKNTMKSFEKEGWPEIPRDDYYDYLA